MRYWWVNHKQTARQELAGGYLWSPKREASGARSQFYENMRRAEPGDRVLSYSNGQIGHVGTVQDFAMCCPKPDSFGSIGGNWSNEGWLLPVKWRPISPVKPKAKLQSLAPLLSKKYSPINSTSGNGNQKAYLAEVGRPVFELLTDVAGSEDDSVLQALSPLHPILRSVDENAEKQIIGSPDIDSTTKEQLNLARVGQGLFRSQIFRYEHACRLTNIENPRLLIASHIKPWRLCNSAAERLDGANGLLLTPHVDHLFDRGLITFQDDGAVVISPRLAPLDLERLGLQSACTAVQSPLHADQAPYMEFHRANIFLT